MSVSRLGMATRRRIISISSMKVYRREKTCVSGPLHSYGSYESKCFPKLQYMAYMSLFWFLEYYFHYIICVESESL